MYIPWIVGKCTIGAMYKINLHKVSMHNPGDGEVLTIQKKKKHFLEPSNLFAMLVWAVVCRAVSACSWRDGDAGWNLRNFPRPLHRGAASCMAASPAAFCLQPPTFMLLCNIVPSCTAKKRQILDARWKPLLCLKVLFDSYRAHSVCFCPVDITIVMVKFYSFYRWRPLGRWLLTRRTNSPCSWS